MCGVGIRWETFFILFLPIYPRKASAFRGNLPLCAFIGLPRPVCIIEPASVL